MAQILQLELYRPFTYVKNDGLDPFAVSVVEGELLFQFERNDDGSPGRLMYAGYELFDAEIHEEIELPAGKYLFAQERALLAQSAIIHLFKELGKNAKQDGISLAAVCFLRYLFEDGKMVTQIFCKILS